MANPADMPRLTTVRSRVLLPFMLAMLALIAGSGVSLYVLAQREIVKESSDVSRTAFKHFELELERDTATLGAALEVISQDDMLRSAFMAQDREALLKGAEPLLERLREQYKITHFYFLNPDRVCFLRVHQPKRRGDTIDRFTAREAERTGRLAHGMELGPLGTFTLRAVVPWRDGGRIIGYLELGQEIERVIAHLHETLGLEFYVAVHKDVLDRESWQDGTKMLGREGAWERFPTSVVAYQTLPTIPAEMAQYLTKGEHGYEAADVEMSIAQRRYRVAFFELEDASGSEVADLIVLRDVTASDIVFRRVFTNGLLACLVVGAGLFVFFYVFLGRVDRTLSRQTTDLAAANEELRAEVERRKEIARSLDRSRQFLQTVIDAIPSATMVVGLDHRVVLANRAAREAAEHEGLGLDNLKCHQVSHHRDAPCEDMEEPCPLKEVVATKAPVHVVHHHGKEQRTVAIVAAPIFDDAGEVVQIVEVCTDITERKRLEEQLLRASKMEAVGRLAGGVAHDFNNLLTAINGFSEMALAKLRPSDPLAEDIGMIRDAGERAASLTRQLLAFSRRQIMQPQVLDLNAVVRNMDKMLRRLMGEDIARATVLAPDLDHVKVDPGQIEQVIMNLTVNARDAMPDGGRITMETANICLDEDYVSTHVDARPGPHVMLALSDDGPGMDAETLDHIFEPFFTTKGSKGTGLGLSIVHGIVEQSGGHIDVHSELGQGATFRVYLPSVDEEADATSREATPADTARGTKTVLLVEDEEIVRKLTERVLVEHGYTLLVAESAEEALRISATHKRQVHLVLTDVVLPDMNGKKLTDRLVEQRPGMKVLYMSGYTDDAIVHRGVLDDGVAFISKPFAVKALLHKVRGVLDGGEREQ